MWRGQVKEEDRAEIERQTEESKGDIERGGKDGEREKERLRRVKKMWKGIGKVEERAKDGERAKERPRSEEEKKLSIRLFSSLKRGVPFYILPGFQG